MTDEYGRAPTIIDGTKPGSVKLRVAMFGPTVVPRPLPPDPSPGPAFVNDQPQE